MELVELCIEEGDLLSATSLSQQWPFLLCHLANDFFYHICACEAQKKAREAGRVVNRVCASFDEKKALPSLTSFSVEHRRASSLSCLIPCVLVPSWLLTVVQGALKESVGVCVCAALPKALLNRRNHVNSLLDAFLIMIKHRSTGNKTRCQSTKVIYFTQSIHALLLRME